MHERLNTNSMRVVWSGCSANYVGCANCEEYVFHVIKDCRIAKEIWDRTLLPVEVRPFSLISGCGCG